MSRSHATLSRRQWLGTIAGAGAALLAAPISRAFAAPAAPVKLTVYKTPTCGCCGNWVDLARKAGYEVDVKDMADVSPTKRMLGIPEHLWSCHTVVAGGYAFEGHVPLDLVQKVLEERPQAVGIAVPGMPVGSPGMEVPGMRPHRYDVVLFKRDGTTSVYAKR